MMNLLVRLMRDDDGQDLVEYALLVSVIAVVAAVGVNLYAGHLSAFFSGLAATAGLAGTPP